MITQNYTTTGVGAQSGILRAKNTETETFNSAVVFDGTTDGHDAIVSDLLEVSPKATAVFTYTFWLNDLNQDVLPEVGAIMNGLTFTID